MFEVGDVVNSVHGSGLVICTHDCDVLRGVTVLFDGHNPDCNFSGRLFFNDGVGLTLVNRPVDWVCHD